MSLAGEFRGAFVRPYVQAIAIVSLRGIGIAVRLSLLIDTGSDRTMVGSRDFERFAIRALQLRSPQQMRGVGGFAEAYVSQHPDLRGHGTKLSVRLSPGHSYRTLDEFGRDLPSLLGRDILNRWHMNYRPTENFLRFDVVDADETFELQP